MALRIRSGFRRLAESLRLEETLARPPRLADEDRLVEALAITRRLGRNFPRAHSDAGLSHAAFAAIPREADVT